MTNQQLITALRWLIEESAVLNDNDNSFRDSGCGCCSGTVTPSDEVRETILAVMQPDPARSEA